MLGYAVGLDMTRRDLQQDSKDKRRSWDTSKDFEFSGLCSALCPPDKGARPDQGAITLHVNGALGSGDLPIRSGRWRKSSPICRRCISSRPVT